MTPAQRLSDLLCATAVRLGFDPPADVVALSLAKMLREERRRNDLLEQRIHRLESKRVRSLNPYQFIVHFVRRVFT